MTDQEKEAVYLLQRIDCNCNNCFFMVRDLETYNKWEQWHRELDLTEFEKKKAKALADAEALEDEQQRKAMLFKANKMKFQFNKSKLINYGNCTKFKKPVTFIQNTCQIETQKCFIHRNDMTESFFKPLSNEPGIH